MGLKLNPRLGTSIGILPGLRLWISIGKNGPNFSLMGNGKMILRSLQKGKKEKKVVAEQKDGKTTALPVEEVIELFDDLEG